MTETAPATMPKPDASETTAHWGAVWAMALCTFVLVASEFLPVSLLSPMADALDLTEGQAGQTIAASGLFAVIASLSVARLTRRFQRQHVMLVLTALLIVSAALVAAAQSYALLMIGRAVLGIAIGGFWSMSTAIAMRLVPEKGVPKALAIINGGNALAMALAAPIGSMLGDLIGWRGAFWSLIPVAVVAVVWQAFTLPKMLTKPAVRSGGLLPLVRQSAVVAGMATVALLFAGQFAMFTYLRPFLEQVTGVGVSIVSLMLLVVGASGFFGTIVIGRIVEGRLFLLLAALPALMALAAFALAIAGGSAVATGLLLALWGFTATAAPVAWWTWLARTVPDNAEAGGGLMVAVIQIAITMGATIGGFAFDAFGPKPTFALSGIVLALACAAALGLGVWSRRSAERAEA